MHMLGIMKILYFMGLLPILRLEFPNRTCNGHKCLPDQYCFNGSKILCIQCNSACMKCNGPTSRECTACADGYHYNLSYPYCTRCPLGLFGVNCSAICHCSDAQSCHRVTGHCSGKCEKGYFKPHVCQEACPDHYYGLDCIEECHCEENHVCDKKLGFCPNGLCHSDWTGNGCSKRLPKLSKAPTVVLSTCSYVTVQWPAWNKENDFGDLPIGNYRLYSHQRGSESSDWKLEFNTSSNPGIVIYSKNITGLMEDGVYQFRVDVHYSDDGKIADEKRIGLTSAETIVPCATTTVPPPITVPIFIAPQGSVRDLIVSDVWPKSVFLSWKPVVCSLRGGNLLHYDVKLQQLDGVEDAVVTSTNSTLATVLYLSPSTHYNASVRYVNSAGAGPYNDVVVFLTPPDVPASVTISSLSATDTTIEVNVSHPVSADGLLFEYYVQYSTTQRFTFPKSHSFNAEISHLLILNHLLPEAEYYIQVRGRSSAGYGPYGNVMSMKTLPAVPYSVESFVLSSSNQTCIAMSWKAAEQPDAEMKIRHMVKIVKVLNGRDERTLFLPASANSYTQCGLDPRTSYSISLSTVMNNTTSSPRYLLVKTDMTNPPPPHAPTLIKATFETATVLLHPSVLPIGPVWVYQVEIEQLPVSSNRARRSIEVIGYVTAQFSQEELTESRQLVIGDNRTYGGYHNVVLQPGHLYRLRFVVCGTWNNNTAFSVSNMSELICTLSPDLTSDGASPACTESTTMTIPSQLNRGHPLHILLTIVIALLILALVSVSIVFYLLKRHKNTSHQFSLFEDSLEAVDSLRQGACELEKYWSLTTALREKRCITVGRECLPESQLLLLRHSSKQQSGSVLTFVDEFQSLPRTFDHTATGTAAQYISCNRFPHILPYDHSRVDLSADAVGAGIYINASFISGYRRRRQYIAAQSPFDDATAVDFWRMVLQHSIKTVVLVANVVEDSVVKCTQFWPRNGEVQLGHLILCLVKETVYAHFTVCDIVIHRGQNDEAMLVRLFEFTSWPEHGVPDNSIPFLEMQSKVRQHQGDDSNPIVVHCGTGIGRSGVFIAVDSLAVQYEKEGRISVFAFVCKLRKERPLMVRTLKQYIFIYECLLEQFHAGNIMINAMCFKEKYHSWNLKNSKTGHSFLKHQFRLLQRMSREHNTALCNTASTMLNRKLSRYPDIVPDDFNNSQLYKPVSSMNKDYINLLYVDGYRMIYDHHVSTVVSLDGSCNSGHSCAQYWPSGNTIRQLEPFFIETSAVFQQENITVRSMKVLYTAQPHDTVRVVRQFQFNAWAENSSTPISKAMLLDLLELVVGYQDNCGYPCAPIVVHCKNGATRSGLFVAMALLCEKMVEAKEVDLYHTVKYLKHLRYQIVNDYDQFRFCYKTLWDFMNLRVIEGELTDILGQTRQGKVYGTAQLSFDSFTT